MKSINHKKHTIAALLLLCLLAFTGREAHADTPRVQLVSQINPSNNTGFYLHLENNALSSTDTTNGSPICVSTSPSIYDLSHLQVILWIGTGTNGNGQFNYDHLIETPVGQTANGQPWQLYHTYTVKAVINSTSASCTLDEIPLTQGWQQGVPADTGPWASPWLPANPPTAGLSTQPVSGGWSQLEPGTLVANYSAYGEQAPADYIVTQQSLSITDTGASSTSGISNVDFKFNPLLTSSLLFSPQSPQQLSNWQVGSTTSGPNKITVTATFCLYPGVTNAAVPLSAYGPFLDQYGQGATAYWNGKVASDSDLHAADAQERLFINSVNGWWKPVRSVSPATGQVDLYGGTNTGWTFTDMKGKPNYYQVGKHNGAWWMIDPAGNPLFYTGLDTAPALVSDQTKVAGRKSLFPALLQGPPSANDPLYSSLFAFDPLYPQSAVWSADNSSVAIPSYNVFRKLSQLNPQSPVQDVNWRQDESKLTAQRLGAWGFTGLGKFATDNQLNQPALAGVPDISVIWRDPSYSLTGISHPDPFDTSSGGGWAKFQNYISNEISARMNDPLVVGWSVGNENENIQPQEITNILQMTVSVPPAKTALTDYLLDNLYAKDTSGNPRTDAQKVQAVATATGAAGGSRQLLYTQNLGNDTADVESLRLYYEDYYFQSIRTQVKKCDPKHLYFGTWIAVGNWVDNCDWVKNANYCDVVGYDRYAFAFKNGSFDSLIKNAGKPILCGEFSFPAHYDGTRGYGTFGNVWTRTDAESGTDYTQWLADATNSPFCVGTCWFQYRDEPLTGRSIDAIVNPQNILVQGEDYALGMVDVTDRPKWDLVTPARTANLAAFGNHALAPPVPGP